MGTNYGRKVTEGISFLLLTGIFYFYNNYMEIGGFGVGYQYIGCIVLTGIGFCVFLVVPDLPYFSQSAKTTGVLLLSYFVAMISSMVIWIFSFTPIRQMISGFFEPAYMMLCIICAMALAYILRERLADSAFWALTAAFALLLFPRIKEFGIAEFFRRLLLYLQSGGNAGWGISLEETSFAYLYVFFTIYYALHWKEKPVWKRCLVAGVILFGLLVTFKRSGMLALAVGFLISFVYFRLGEKARKYFLYLLVASFLIFSLLYIPFVRYGLFNRIMEALQISTSHRDEIYTYYARYYEFSPGYLGRGLGWIQRLRNDLDSFGNGLVALNVHCDYVYYYIELGFWGYLFWIFLAFPWLLRCTVKGRSVRNDAVIVGISVAMALLRLTENISFLYSAVLGFSVLVMQCVLQSQDGKEKTVKRKEREDIGIKKYSGRKRQRYEKNE